MTLEMLSKEYIPFNNRYPLIEPRNFDESEDEVRTTSLPLEKVYYLMITEIGEGGESANIHEVLYLTLMNGHNLSGLKIVSPFEDSQYKKFYFNGRIFSEQFHQLLPPLTVQKPYLTIMCGEEETRFYYCFLEVSVLCNFPHQLLIPSMKTTIPIVQAINKINHLSKEFSTIIQNFNSY